MSSNDADDVPASELFWQFWLAPSLGSAAALFRIGYGLLAVWTAIGVLFNVPRYYSNDGLLPWSTVSDFPEHVFSLIALAPTSAELAWLLASAFLAAAITLTLGVWPRVSALVIFIVNVALQHRNPYVVNAGDRLFLIFAALSALLPLGHRWSVAAWLRERRRAEAPRTTTVWSQRLIALQVAYVYLSSCFSKLQHGHWRDGTAVHDVLASPVLSEWPVSLDFAPLVRLLTWSTLAFELLFPLFVWQRRYRPYLLGAGVLFHFGIEVALTIPIFSAIMIVSYACFMSDSEAEALVARLDKWGRRRAAAPRRGAAAAK